jgi:hypothetical protein
LRVRAAGSEPGGQRPFDTLQIVAGVFDAEGRECLTEPVALSGPINDTMPAPRESTRAIAS